MPPNVADTEPKVEELEYNLEDLDLKKLVREKGFYGVHPEIYVRIYINNNCRSSSSSRIIGTVKFVSSINKIVLLF